MDLVLQVQLKIVGLEYLVLRFKTFFLVDLIFRLSFADLVWKIWHVGFGRLDLVAKIMFFKIFPLLLYSSKEKMCV